MSYEIKDKDDFVTRFKNGIEVTDSRGRIIKIRQPGRLANLKLAEALGSAADNDRYFRMIQCVNFVLEIDGLPFSVGGTKREVEAAYDRLGDDGETAIAQFFIDNVEKEMIKNESEEKFLLKK